jgi:hypothetical protein
MIRLATLITLALALLVAAPAEGGGFGGGLDRAERAADEAFPGHCSPVSIRFGRVPPRTYAITRDPCGIVLHREIDRKTFKVRCTIIVHETGHLAGLRHSSDPTSIMYPRPRVWPACRY